MSRKDCFLSKIAAVCLAAPLIMRSLGAVDAVNLDGGGSTTMTINQQLVNRPSDTTGERPIADAMYDSALILLNTVPSVKEASYLA